MPAPRTRNHVLIFSLSYHPRFVGGAEVALREITGRLPDFEFHMVTLRFDSRLPKTERIGNVIVHRIGFSLPHPSIADLRKFPLRLNKFLYQFLAVPHALMLHRKYRFNLLWAMMAHACGIPAGLFKALHPNVPYVLTLQEGDPPEAIERSMRFVFPLFAQAFKKADALQAISRFLASWGVRRGFRGTPDVIPNGVDLAHFTSVTPQARHKGTRLITASRLVSKNGVDTVIRALPLLPPDVSFVICGIGPDEGMLRTLAASCGVSDRVIWRGEVSHAELPSILASCDIFIRASRSEGMGNSFIEAMAVGIPVIGTDVGGIPDFIVEGDTGYVVPPDAHEAIAACVKRILENPAAAEKIAARGKALALSRYGWDRIAGEMSALFARLIG